MRTRMTAMGVCMTLLLITTWLQPAHADATRDELDKAIAKHQEAAKVATAILKKAIEDKLKSAVLEDRLETAKALIEAKESLKKTGRFPPTDSLKEDVAAYATARKASASELLKAFDKAKGYYLTNGLMEEARKIAAERAKFVDEELEAIEVEIKRVETPRTKTTKDHFEEFYKSYSSSLEAVMEEDTTAKALEAHQAMSQKLDDALKTQTWTFRCRIKDVHPGGVLDIAAPFETPGFSERWNFRESVGNLGLAKAKLLAIAPGDILEITGTPRFTGDSVARAETKFFSTSTEVGNRYFEHAIHITRHKFSVRKPTEEEAAEIREVDAGEADFDSFFSPPGLRGVPGMAPVRRRGR